MSGKQAKLLSPGTLRRALARARSSTFPERDSVILLLSVRAGLRACEIAGLDWSMVVDARRHIGRTIELADWVAKKGSGRRIPLHPELRAALAQLAPLSERFGPVIRSAKGGSMRASSLVNWFRATYSAIGAGGCTSHSGRRTFITHAARRAHMAGASLRDVQLLAGHRSIETTQGYIEGDSDAQRRLVQAL